MTAKKIVLVYTAPSCGPCIALKRFLGTHSIPYESFGPQEAANQGYRSVPVTVVDGTEIFGFDEAKLKEHLLND